MRKEMEKIGDGPLENFVEVNNHSLKTILLKTSIVSGIIAADTSLENKVTVLSLN